MMLSGNIRLKMDVQSLALSCWDSVNLALSASEVWLGALSNTWRSSAFGLPSTKPGWMRFTIIRPRMTAHRVVVK